MKIVIDINDRVYGLLKYFEESLGLDDKKDGNGDVKTELIRAVLHGTPLPNGHGRLIDESKIKKCGWNFISHHAKTDAPTIIKADTKSEDINNLCNQCSNKRCIFQSGIVRSHCDFYKAESEDEE